MSGKETAFEFLFDKYREKVYAVAFRFVRDKEDALEIVQDVFLRAYQGLAKFKTDSKFFTWLYRITVNRAIDLLRSRKSRPAVELAAREEQDNFEANIADPRSCDPAALFDQKETGRLVLNAVSQLSDKHQAVFLLHAVEELSYKEIAEVLGCSIGTVMSRLFYARKKLQELLAGLSCL
ncbi:MAG: sigma-70 family RNA polymerase sigma factor [Planctomycetes bacterium]|nr:sigma-70 family RNA polymerase sigma factor [Planctomycetota bacterium]